MKLFSFFVAAIILSTAVSASYYYQPHNSYQGPYYKNNVAYSPDGRSFGWDNTYAGNGFAHHTSGYIDEGPYKCIGSGCGSTYYLHSTNYYGYNNEYYNSKHHAYYWDPAQCSGYWRGGCEHVQVGRYSNNYYQDFYNNW